MTGAYARHGTYTGYTTHGCRCDRCREAMCRYNKQRLAAIARGEWQPWADIGEVRQHVKALRQAGLSFDLIADLAGVDRRNVELSLSPDRKRVRTSFAEKVLAVTVDLDQMPDWAKVDATGTRRRLQALMYAGWSANTLADMVGLERLAIRKLMDRPRVRVFTARAVRKVFADLCNRMPPCEARYERASVTRAQRHARAQGWAPAMAWDDIDDPREKPKGIRREAS
ncbi:hypothetical protein [Nonomuraea pusilla]|uniref:Uncharacterized protein n=1 Tax=Nonomuraea pusilla TaxID=46177 RepID=A0A1H8K686_9ACTN|nr:hypothetical protein [Nonomuraea pusilla]SEN87898.1 hypothetical protein SAMN05660976_08521 [Nonomuraea pusilla]